MASGKVFNSSRYSPYPTNAPTTLQSQASSSRAAFTPDSVDLISPMQPILLRYERYQDDMPVKSIEAQEEGFTGLRHYEFMRKYNNLDSKPSLDHVGARDLDAHPDADALDEADTDAPAFTGAPTPPLNINAYTQPIYRGTTHNPAVCLAILRIAQRNLPGTNFVSALNHIPNIRPADPLPALVSTAPGNLAPAPFLDWQRPTKKPDDKGITVAFLPSFYGDRHAIAYWQYVHDFKRGVVLGSACIAPCSEAELRRYGLVEYIAAEDLAAIGARDGVEAMRSVGAEDGFWLERDVIEDWEEWRAAFRTCAVHWERRMKLVRGAHEG